MMRGHDPNVPYTGNWLIDSYVHRHPPIEPLCCGPDCLACPETDCRDCKPECVCLTGESP